MLLIPVIAFLVAFAVTAALVRVRPLLHRSGDDNRRDGAPLVPRLGGVALVTGTVSAILVALLMRGAGLDVPAAWVGFAPLLMAAAALVFVLGLVDDLRGVRPAGKLVVQVIAACLAWSAGVRIESVVFPPDITIAVGPLAFPITVLWLVGASNALNLVDGLDGLAALETVIALACIVGSALALNNNGVLLLAVAMLGATLAFLRANWHPARIFLGDSGSLVIGFMLAVGTVEAARRSNGAVLIMVPLMPSRTRCSTPRSPFSGAGCAESRSPAPMVATFTSSWSPSATPSRRPCGSSACSAPAWPPSRSPWRSRGRPWALRWRCSCWARWPGSQRGDCAGSSTTSSARRAQPSPPWRAVAATGCASASSRASWSDASPKRRRCRSSTRCCPRRPRSSASRT